MTSRIPRPANVNAASSACTPTKLRINLSSLTSTSLSFNPTPKFLGVTFGRTLSFGSYVHSLRTKFFSRFKALRSLASAGPSKEPLSQLYKAFIRPVFSFASPGWFPFRCNTLKIDLEVYHRSACRAIFCCLVFTPISLLLFESLPLSTLKHQALAFYERPLLQIIFPYNC